MPRTILVLTLLLVTITIISTAMPAYATNSRPTVKPVKDIDDMFDDVAAISPAFGGMYLDGNVLKVYLTDPSQRGVAEQAIRAVFGRERVPAGDVQAVQGTYGFHHPHAWPRHTGSAF